jgi:hypothetical protein
MNSKKENGVKRKQNKFDGKNEVFFFETSSHVDIHTPNVTNLKLRKIKIKLLQLRLT